MHRHLPENFKLVYYGSDGYRIDTRIHTCKKCGKRIENPHPVLTKVLVYGFELVCWLVFNLAVICLRYDFWLAVAMAAAALCVLYTGIHFAGCLIPWRETALDNLPPITWQIGSRPTPLLPHCAGKVRQDI